VSAPSVAPSVRRVLKNAATAAARLAPKPDPTARRVILCYHSVGRGTPYASASPEGFAEHLDWLRDNCDVVPLDALVARTSVDHASAGRPCVAITFDDGYRDNYESAFPILAARRMTAVFFVTVGFLERDPEVFARLTRIWGAPGDELNPLGWSDVGEMQAEGMGFGSHTWSHPNLAELSPAAARAELCRSKAVLEDRLGQLVGDIAYPFGKLRHHVSDATFHHAHDAGYRHGYVSLPRAVADRDHLLRIPRFGVGNDSVASLAAKVGGEIDWHAIVHERCPASVSRMLFPRYP
jgi:peptidoglycan/xylan/chitin deacetylase (PgdA/CDA1 family)